MPRNPPQKPLFLTEDKVARMLGVSALTLRKGVKNGDFPSPTRIGNALIWPVSRIDEWLDAELRGDTAQDSRPAAPVPDASPRAPAPAPAPRPMFLRPIEVARMLGVSRGSLYRWAREGVFPPPSRLSGMTSGWPLATVEAWIALRTSKGALPEPGDASVDSARMGRG